MVERIISKLFVILVGFIFCGLVLIAPQMVYGADETEKLEDRLEKSMNVSLLDKGAKERVIQCFDVNGSGWFAIGYRGNIIHVFDQSGTFQYGYRFDCTGDFGIEFRGDNLTIYRVRSKTMAVLDATGNCVYAEEVSLPHDVLDNFIHRVDKQVGNTRYSLERDVGLFYGDYSRLVATDELGNRTVLYDVTVLGYFVGAFHYILILIFPLAGLAALKKKLNEDDNEKRI